MGLASIERAPSNDTKVNAAFGMLRDATAYPLPSPETCLPKSSKGNGHALFLEIGLHELAALAIALG